MGKPIATREAYGEILKELGSSHPEIVVLDADLSKSTKTNVFGKSFPERFINVGIAEQNLMGVAAGLATCGKTPFASTFAIFATGRAYEQIRNSICYPKLNVKVAASHAGLTVGEDGATHQALEDVSLMRSLPNMSVIIPADAEETRQAVTYAASHKGPMYLRLGRMAVPEVNGEGYRFVFGKATELRQGTDATIIACGIMVSVALQAAELLAQEGKNVRVLNMHTIKPIDKDAIVQAAKETGGVVTCEEHSVYGGLGSAVAEVLGEKAPVPMERVGVQDTFGESGTPDALLKKYGLTAEGVAEAVKRVISRKG